jgi:hypothetical protein
MANTIRIKRRSSAGAAGAPGSLENAELAYNEADDVLYYGKGTGGANGTATTVEAIAGFGAYVSLGTTQTISGAKTFSGTVALGSSATATTKSPGNNSTAVATTAYVDSAITSSSSSFTVSGDSGTNQTITSSDTFTISGGTGLSSVASNTDTITINLDNTAVSAGTYGSATAVGSFTVDAQGRLTAASSTNIAIASTAVTDFTEAVQDAVGAMLSSNTESGISVEYDDEANKINFNVNDPVITIAGDVDGSATMTDLGNTTINVTLDTVNSNTGAFGSSTAIPVITVNGKGLVTAVTTQAISTTLTVAANTGTADSVALGTDTLTFTGTAPIATAVTNNTITISATDASTSAKGVASFSSADFDVTTGTVSVKDLGISNAQLAGSIANEKLSNSSITLGSRNISLGATDTTIAGITEFTVDNININGNEISSTDTNGNISLSPNGTGNIAVNNSKITGLLDPTGPQDAATKSYVDSVAEGLHVHEAVHAITTIPLATITGDTVTYNNGTNGVGATLTLSTALDLAGGDIDGDTDLDITDRIIVAGESNAAHNGIYVITSTTVLTRASDFDTPAEMAGGDFVFVTHGTNYANTGWVMSEAVTVVGTDPVLFIQFSGAGTFLAGNGLDLTGNTFSVNVAATGGIEISSDALQLKSTVAGDGLTLTSGVLAVVGTADRITASADSIDIASTYVGQSSITTLGTIGTGTWQGTVVGSTYGGTGVNNGSSTITLGGNLVTSGANSLTLTTTGTTNVTLPTTGTLATLAGAETLSSKTITSSSIGSSSPSTAAFTTLTANSTVTFTGATASTSHTTGTLVITGGVGISGALYGNSSTLSGFIVDGGTF